MSVQQCQCKSTNKSTEATSTVDDGILFHLFIYLLRLYSTSAEGLQDTRSYSLLKMVSQNSMIWGWYWEKICICKHLLLKKELTVYICDLQQRWCYSSAVIIIIIEFSWTVPRTKYHQKLGQTVFNLQNRAEQRDPNQPLDRSLIAQP